MTRYKIYDIITFIKGEDDDLGRHERLVTVGGFGKQEGLHKKKQSCLLE